MTHNYFSDIARAVPCVESATRHCQEWFEIPCRKRVRHRPHRGLLPAQLCDRHLRESNNGDALEHSKHGHALPAGQDASRAQGARQDLRRCFYLFICRSLVSTGRNFEQSACTVASTSAAFLMTRTALRMWAPHRSSPPSRAPSADRRWCRFLLSLRALDDALSKRLPQENMEEIIKHRGIIDLVTIYPPQENVVGPKTPSRTIVSR